MSSLKAFEADSWNRQAEGYDLLTGRVTARVASPLLDAADVMAGHRVLDVACGTGALSAAATRRGASPLGVDLADAMVAAARAELPGVEFRVADAEALPFPDDRFDAALGGFVLNHLPHPARCAEECARVVAPGGGVAFAVWERPDRSRLIALLGEALERAGGDRTAGVPEGPDDFRYADGGRMRRLLESAGLVEVDVSTVDLSVQVDGADELWDGLVGGLVRAPAALAAHDDSTRARVRAVFDELVTEFRADGGGLSVPAVVRMGAGRVPATG
jgi:SAM-dependent methyltransferase